MVMVVVVVVIMVMVVVMIMVRRGIRVDFFDRGHFQEWDQGFCCCVFVRHLLPNHFAAFPGLFRVRRDYTVTRGCEPQTIGLRIIPSVVLLDRCHTNGAFNRNQETRFCPL